MKSLGLLSSLLVCASLSTGASASEIRLSLPDHKGLLHWSAVGFTPVQSSAKPQGREIGIRGRGGASGDLVFVTYLFLAPETAPMTSAACRDSSVAHDKADQPALKVLQTSESPRLPGPALALVTYTTPNKDGSPEYVVHGFLATGDICGDLAFYSRKPISYDDPDLKSAFLAYQFDPDYTPRLPEVAFYAQVLYNRKDYKAAAPIFEEALALVPPDGSPFPSAAIARRVIRDQAGMAYGIAGEFTKARGIFEKGTIEDPDYPIYYYNLACTDAEEHKLNEAKAHLLQAFDRKSHLNPGEQIPDPTQDDSFLPYKNDKQFWDFLLKLSPEK